MDGLLGLNQQTLMRELFDLIHASTPHFLCFVQKNIVDTGGSLSVIGMGISSSLETLVLCARSIEDPGSHARTEDEEQAREKTGGLVLRCL